MRREVLVVEDNADLARLLGTWMTANGFPATIVGGRAEGLEKAGGGNYAVALVDVKLPDGDGLDVVRELTRCRPHTRSVVFTAVPDEQSMRAAFDAGANDFLVKGSFDMGELREALERGVDYHDSLERTAGMVGRLDKVERDFETMQTRLRAKIKLT